MQTHRKFDFRLVTGLLIGLLSTGCGNVEPAAFTERDSLENKLQAASHLSQLGRADDAIASVRELLLQSPDEPRVLALAVQIHRAANQHCQAAELANRLVELSPQQSPAMLMQIFDMYLRCGDFAKAEASVRRAIKLKPDHVAAHRLLARLLTAQGRRYEASQHVQELLRLRAAVQDEVLSLVDLRTSFSLMTFDDFIGESVSLFALGQARHAYVALNEPAEQVLESLRRVRQYDPSSTAAAAFQGRVLAEHAKWELLQHWFSELPPGIEQQPEYWNAIGIWLSHQNREQESVRAFSEAIYRDPTDRASLRGMVRSLDSLGQGDTANQIRERLATLDRIFRIAKGASADEAGWISNELMKLTRPWESVAWLQFAMSIEGTLANNQSVLQARYAAIMQWQKDATDQQILDARVGRLLGFDHQQWPMPDLNLLPTVAAATDSETSFQPIVLTDVAPSIGLIAQYDSGLDFDSGRYFLHQVNGGGMAAIDFDLDGWCDVYIAQAGGKPNDPVGSSPNQLFRLLSSGQYQEIADLAAVDDQGFGQGVCAGDVNQDGFPDLIVANIGTNTLYINQGDGTFRQRSDLIHPMLSEWTSSIGLADLSGDHLPELIEVNYVDDPEVYRVQCAEVHTPCQPQRFRSAADRAYQAQPDGTFAPNDHLVIMNEDPKLGFGLVIANFDRRHGNDVFITNDGDLNHYWVSSPILDSKTGTDSQPRQYSLQESANLRGCSIGAGGNSQACMGVAFGDFNRDGHLDLHVTNFYHEPVNLYMQNELGFFSDEALRYNLAEASFSVLGFGTHAADFDNDGWLDLAVLNGHVYDARSDGVAYRMRPQLFRGHQGGFHLRDADNAGNYWQASKLGRTLALLDWNRDGKMDLLANHLDQPVVLLSNETDSTANWIQFELVGVVSERDAIGAEITVHLPGQSLTGWQIGGDGFMCTNEPIIHFGLGEADTIERIEVAWPSGDRQTFGGLASGHRYLIVEGQSVFER